MKTQFSSVDLHNHLYGVLSPQDLWEIGQKTWGAKSERLTWYADEFAKACGYRPDYASYWQSENGLDQLTKDYLFITQENFAIFQAKFNLLIALCPMSDSDSIVLDKVLQKQNPCDFVEYRMIFPSKHSPFNRRKILDLYANKLEQASQNFSVHARIAWSLSRKPEEFLESFKFIHEWRLANPKMAHFFSGVDLCGDEESDPPKNKEAEFKVMQELQLKSSLPPLLLLHHVGEVFKKNSFFTSLRRIFEVCNMGAASRIGHASALTIGLSHLPEEEYYMEDSEEEYSNNCHFYPEYKKIFPNKRSTTSSWKQYALQMQPFVWNKIEALSKEHKIIFETCPTSNLLISACKEKDLPTLGFLEKHSKTSHKNWEFFLGSDDPGIMNTTLEKEFEIITNLTPHKALLQNTKERSLKYFENNYAVFFP